ncbi:hypothetical protein SODG_004327 [Sodalis praecaptivus]
MKPQADSFDSTTDDIPLRVIYDLHSHTSASDGLLTPRELVVRAQAMDVTVLAITDHDTVDGLAPAREAIAALRLPLNLVAGWRFPPSGNTTKSILSDWAWRLLTRR